MKVCLKSDLCNNHLINLSPKAYQKLTNFFTAQEALSLALQEAKPLGTCKITTSISQDPTGISTSIEGLEEMSS